jgi:hypothetical protein
MTVKRQQRAWAWADNLRLHVIAPGWPTLATAVRKCHELEASGIARGVEPVTLPDGTFTASARQLCVMGFWIGDQESLGKVQP